MRTIEVTIGDTVYAMPVDFPTSMKLDEHPHVGDPIRLSQTLMKAREEDGVAQVQLTMRQVIAIITVGVRAAGCQMTNEAIGDAIVASGVQDYILVAARYVVAMVSGEPAAPVQKEIGEKKAAA